MKKYKDKEILSRLYVEEKKSTYKVGRILGCSQPTILYWLKKHDIRTRAMSESKIGNSYAKRSLTERFLEKVNVGGEDECWEWVANCFQDGYGAIGVDGKLKGAHVVSWELYHNRKASRRCVIHHMCGNKKCCNPNHLQEISNSEHKSMHARGENCGSAKLTAEQVLEMRAKHTGKWGEQTILAEEYGVGHRTICDIINYKTWKHI